MPKQFSYTLITLIPKEDKSAKMNQFRQISLCNILHSTRQYPNSGQSIIVPSTLNGKQCSFLEEKYRNSIIGQEISHSMERKE